MYIYRKIKYLKSYLPFYVLRQDKVYNELLQKKNKKDTMNLNYSTDNQKNKYTTLLEKKNQNKTKQEQK